MGVYLADQTMVFLQALVVGAALGLLFDAFRISRIAIPTGSVVVFIEDLLFFIICAIVTFSLLMSAVEGKVRMFLIIGELLGAILYRLTVGQLVMAVSKTIINVVKGILSFIYRWFIRPIWRFVYKIVALLLRPFYFFAGIIKKSMQRCKFRLKVRRILLYNQFIVRLSAKQKKTGAPNPHEEEQEAT